MKRSMSGLPRVLAAATVVMFTCTAIAFVQEHSGHRTAVRVPRARAGRATALRTSEACPRIRVLVLSLYSDDAYVTQALNAGAAGYLLTDSVDVDLLRAIAAVADGQSLKRRSTHLDGSGG